MAAIPCLRYADAPAMIDWLCRAFGFARHAVHEDGEGGIAHAQLTLGRGMIMLGSMRDDAYGALQSGPACQTSYLVVADADAVLANALAAGAEIVLPIEDKPYGGRDFTCRDPEGHLWSVGTYDPWADQG